ncbi:hypothetical protein ACHAXA_004616 [Cyclostephanos tholiformis]|uniref:Uncharacterized protein n=1 Tax=Cyclostephanos tholiformis TaxID=382380 RepID=A0ABD3SP94_9STRA
MMRHWPALVYRNLAEVIRDMPPGAPRVIKARLLVEHLRRPDVAIARLIGWDIDPTTRFPETNMRLLRLDGIDPFNDDDDGGGVVVGDGDGDGAGGGTGTSATMDFVDGQFEMERACDEVMRRLRRRRRAGRRRGIGNDGKNDGDEDEDADADAMEAHVRRLRAAIDVALNCLAIDVGADPMPPRRTRDDEDDDDDDAPNNGGVGKGGGVRGVGGEKRTTKKGKDGAARGGEACQNVERTIFSTVVKISGTTTTETNGKVVKGADAVGKHGRGDDVDATTMRTGDETKKGGGGRVKKKRADGASNYSGKTSKGEITDGADTASGKRDATAESVSGSAPSSHDPSRRTGGDGVAALSTMTSEEAVPSWKDVWSAMKRHGWTWKGGSGLMTDYYYIKPKCKVQGGLPGRDYFVRVEDAMEFARDCYGWHQGASSSTISREELFSRIEDHARHCGESVPPLLLGVNGGTMKLDDPYEPWREVWTKMLRSGWTWRTGTGLMLDYFYIKPDCKVGGGVEGQDYFVRLKDVQKFAARNYGWRGGCGVEHGAAPVAAGRVIKTDRTTNVSAHEVQKDNPHRVEKRAKKPAKAKDVRAEEGTTKRNARQNEYTAINDTDDEHL